MLHAACILPAVHYQLDTGMLQVGDPADFIVVNNLQDFDVLTVIIDGEHVAEHGECCVSVSPAEPINHFNIGAVDAGAFRLFARVSADSVTCKVIEAIDGQLITGRSEANLPVVDGYVMPDPAQDVLKIGIVNRYSAAPVAMGFIRNFGLAQGAMASSVAHDSHNIVFVGCSDEDIAAAVNLIIANQGGISVAGNGSTDIMPLPISTFP
ncbi:MAG: adenine deaminase [Sphingobacteriales bacterium]|nr:MAG: adenine deaminase [Sphingobacteriales bacterium]